MDQITFEIALILDDVEIGSAVDLGKYPLVFFRNKFYTRLQLWGASASPGINTYHLNDILNGSKLEYLCPLQTPKIQD